jgi:hypothetical protein
MVARAEKSWLIYQDNMANRLFGAIFKINILFTQKTSCISIRFGQYSS